MPKARLSRSEASLPWAHGTLPALRGPRSEGTKPKHIPAHKRWDQGFIVSIDPDETEWVAFSTYTHAARWAVRAQQRTGILTVVFPRNGGWAYRTRKD